MIFINKCSALLLFLLFHSTCKLTLATKVKAPPLPEQQQQQQQQGGETSEQEASSTAQGSSPAAEEKCRWGEPCASGASGSASSGSGIPTANISTQQKQQQKQQQQSGSQQQATASASASTKPKAKMPFVKNKINTDQSSKQHIPPEGFQVDARVYTDPDDQMAHFDSDGQLLLLPYFDCATTGITTLPLKLQHAYFRHTIHSTTQPANAIFEGSEFFVQRDNAAAILLVTLHDTTVQMELNSGEAQTFPPGSVILLEDVVAGGHKCTSPNGEDVTVLLLTLPPHYTSIKNRRTNGDNNPQYCLSILRPTPKLRRSILTGLGAAAALLLADWLGKVAPIWLSVGIGGGCLVVGGTVGFVKSGESLMDRIEVHRERQRYISRTQQQLEQEEEEGTE